MLKVLTQLLPEVGVLEHVAVVLEADELALAAEQAPVVHRDVGGVDEREHARRAGRARRTARCRGTATSLTSQREQPLPPRRTGVAPLAAGARRPAAGTAVRRCPRRSDVAASSGSSSGQGQPSALDVGQERAPTTRRRTADPSSTAEERCLERLEDVGVLRALVGLHGDGLGPVGEDLAGRGVVEERVGRRRASSGSSSASTWLGKVPLASNALICCSGAVSQAASSLASSWCSPWAGTVR